MPILDVFYAMLWFFLLIAWSWGLTVVTADVFRSRDLKEGAKALWTILIVIIPWLGMLIYVIARDGKMWERQMEAAAAQPAPFLLPTS